MYSVRDLSSRVNALSKNSAENLLEIGSIFLDAKEHLSEKEHSDFLQETHYVENSSTVRKWQRIGQAYLRLKNISHLLPPVFTTLYKLSSLSADELSVLIENNILSPSVTTKEINAELNPQSQKTTFPKLIVCFNEYATEDVVNEINDLLRSYASYLEVKTNDGAQEMIEIATNQSCEQLQVA